MAEDWKAKLASLAGEVPQAEDDTPVQEEKRIGQKGKLNVVLDKKGRKGKMATIIEGFNIPEEEVAEVATKLKQKLATGGSHRDGEILLQGDCKVRATEALREMGFRISMHNV